MNNPFLLAAVSGLLTGGFVSACVAVYAARKKVPVERDSIIVTGAETAVVALEKTLAAETRRADRAESTVIVRDEQLARKDARIAALEQRLDQLQTALDAARQELHDILSQPL